MEKNDYRTNNRYAKRLNQLIEKYKNEEYFLTALNEIMDNNNIKVSSTAAVESLRNNANIDKAIQKLKEISNRKDSGLVGFSSGIALERWEKYGREGIGK